MQDPLLFFVVKIAAQFKNSLRSCQKNFRRFGRQATDMRPHILSGKLRVCHDKPQNFVLSCLLGRKFSFDLFCRFARFVGGIKKAIVIKRLLFCYLFYYLFCGLLFLKSSKRFFKATLVSVSISFSFSTYSFPNQSGSSFAFRF